MTVEKRRPRLGGNERGPRKIIAVDNSDGSELSPQAPKKQASLQRRSDFARAMVFEEFKHKDARAIDYGAFADRKPGLIHIGPVADRIVQRLARLREVRHAS